MELKFKVLLFGLLLSLSMINEVESDCKYNITLKPGETYDVTNPGYPDPNKSKQQCEWNVTSPSVTTITCNTKIKNHKCIESRFMLEYEEGRGNMQYCIANYPYLLYRGQNPHIKYKSSDSPMDTFHCRIEAFNENNCTCGWKDTIKTVDGKKVKSSTYSMMAVIVDKDVKNYCSATIISNQYVLTSDHCIQKLNSTINRLFLGESIMKEGKPGKMYRLHTYATHPSADIALCKVWGGLHTFIEYGPGIGPVCLPFHHNDDCFSKNVTVFGWDRQNPDDVNTWPTLQKTRLNVMTPKQCRDAYPDVNKNYRCGQIREKDFYQMKIDGPVVSENRATCRWVLRGFTISDIDYTSGKAALITPITRPILDWIEETASGQNFCKME